MNSGSALFSGDAVMSRCVDQHTSLLVMIQWGAPLSSPWFVCLCASFPVFVPPPLGPGSRIALVVPGWMVVIVPTEPPEHAKQPTTHPATSDLSALVGVALGKESFCFCHCKLFHSSSCSSSSCARGVVAWGVVLIAVLIHFHRVVRPPCRRCSVHG